MEAYKSKTLILFLTVALLTMALLNQAFAENTLRITTDEDVLSVHVAQRLLLRYPYRNVPFKPCIRRLFSPVDTNNWMAVNVYQLQLAPIKYKDGTV